MKYFLHSLFLWLFLAVQVVFAQLYNNDTLYIAPGTDVFVNYNVSDITNSTNGYLFNEGQVYAQPVFTNDGKFINHDTLAVYQDYYGAVGNMVSAAGSVVELRGNASPRDFSASSSKTDTVDILSVEASVSGTQINMIGNWSIRDSIHFGHGLLTTASSDTLRLTPSSVKTYGNGESYVNGPLEVSLNRELFFPIGGLAQYAPVSVTGLTATGGYYRMYTSADVANPITGTPDSGMSSLSTLTANRYWKSSFINASGITMANTQMTFTYNTDDESVSPDAFVNVAHSATSNGLFKTLGATNLNLSDANYRTITTDTIVSQSKLTGFYCLGERNFIRTNLKVFLEGPYNAFNSNMDALLNPYDFGGGYYQYHLDSLYGSASVIPGYPKMLAGYTIPDSVVDIVHVYLRSGTAYSTTVDSAYAWLLQNGDIVDFETGISSYIRFANQGEGNYYIVVEHRNHLPIMSATVKLVNFSNSPARIDMTDPSNVYLGSWGTKYVSGSEVAMIAGNAYEEGSREINATDYFLTSIANDVNPESVYSPEDLNLDAVVSAGDMILVDINSQYLYYSVVPY